MLRAVSESTNLSKTLLISRNGTRRPRRRAVPMPALDERGSRPLCAVQRISGVIMR